MLKTSYIAIALLAMQAHASEDKASLYNPIKECQTALIEEMPQPLHAIQGSLFSTKLYIQGDKDWKPSKVDFFVKNTEGNGVSGCKVSFLTNKEDGSVFYPINSISDSDGRVSGWWVSGALPDTHLTATLNESPSSVAIKKGLVSTSPHRNLAPATYLGFGSLEDKWSEFSVDITPTHSTKATYFKAIGWSGGYSGIQQTDVGQPKKLIFSVWKSDYGMAEIIEDPTKICKTNTDSAEGDFVQCFMDYPWELGHTYTFHMTATHEVDSAIDYQLKVTDTKNEKTITVAKIRVPEPDDYFPPLASAFIEQFAYDQYSCTDSETRAALYSSIWRVNPLTGKREDIEQAMFSRTYDPEYGHGSLCFNYAYGNIASLPYNETDIEKGFYLSTGGSSLISRPADAAVGINFLNIESTPNYYTIHSQEELDLLFDTSLLDDLLRKHEFVKIETSADKWIPVIKLPLYAAEGNIVRLEVKSDDEVCVVIEQDEIDIVHKNETRQYIYYKGSWLINQYEIASTNKTS